MSPPLPPANFESRKPEIISIPAKAVVHRFYTSTFEPIHFDKSDLGRFNAPDATYGVLYAAREIEGAFAETFLRTLAHAHRYLVSKKKGLRALVFHA
ncbi:RES domain-containing protein [Rhizobium tumorigenes]|uniref:RES domain-containing protein n=1 Tax=Rhizobium tumorigenes TaxID=2041385 RepID=A0AAF1KAB8_9HYPH|nr:RES domain-containing protein [Rhizobium tumorigenes]WFR98615.1 RES domain-containing protein [Rhizobium tumorigenes]